MQPVQRDSMGLEDIGALFPGMYGVYSIVNGVIESSSDSEASIKHQDAKKKLRRRHTLTWMRQNMKERILHVTNHYKNKGMVEYSDFLADWLGRYTQRGV